MTAIAACALPDIEETADPLQILADLAACAMRMARRAAEQYEALTAQPAPNPDAAAEAAKSRQQPDPGTLFTRAARVVLDCITKELRLLAGCPLAAPRLRAAPRMQSPSPEKYPCPEESWGNDRAAETVHQALRTVTRNHPHGQKLLRQGLEHLATALAEAPAQPLDIPGLFRRVCAAAGINLEPSLCRKLARDPVFQSLAGRIPVPS